MAAIKIGEVVKKHDFSMVPPNSTEKPGSTQFRSFSLRERAQENLARYKATKDEELEKARIDGKRASQRRHYNKHHATVAPPPDTLPQRTTIKSILKNLGDEICPIEVVSYIRKSWPNVREEELTLREAMLRVVYLEAISGREWAVNFVANRTEGPVQPEQPEVDRGAICQALDLVAGAGPV